MALARVSFAVGGKAATHALGRLVSGENRKDLVLSQAELVARELGRLKGSVMKAGQMLSVYGEHFLPPEANAVLKSLQSQSPPLEWREIEKQLRRQLGTEKLAQLEIDPTPMAAASLGQVHRARRRGQKDWEYAVKVQYPGIDAAIEGDIQALRTILGIANLIPKGPRYDSVFAEIRSMLRQEVDYRQELEATGRFRQALAGDPRFVVPAPVPEYSSGRVLTTSLELGFAVDSPEVSALPLERRNAIGRAALELYLKELFEFRAVQTDPHFGNYRIRIGGNGEPDRLVCFDFGAAREIPEAFSRHQRKIIAGAFLGDRALLEQGAFGLGMLQKGDEPELQDVFADLCRLIMEPFTRGVYDFGASDLPKRVAKKGAEMVWGFRLRVPPKELVFLDRKMGGMFVFLSALRARFDGSDLLEAYLEVDRAPVPGS